MAGVSKELPENLEMRMTLHLKLDRGGSAYSYDNEEFGIYLQTVRETRKSKTITVWMSDRTGDQEFDSFPQLREAYNKTIPKAVT